MDEDGSLAGVKCERRNNFPEVLESSGSAVQTNRNAGPAGTVWAFQRSQIRAGTVPYSDGTGPKEQRRPFPPFYFIGGNAASKSRKGPELQPRQVILTKYRFEFLGTKDEVSERR